MRYGLSRNISIFKWIWEYNYINMGAKVNRSMNPFRLKGKLLRPANWGRI
jgi:hypothetical protein